MNHEDINPQHYSQYGMVLSIDAYGTLYGCYRYKTVIRFHQGCIIFLEQVNNI